MLWSILYTDDAGTVSRSKDSLAKIMSVVVETCDTFGLTVSENKTETMALLPQAAPAERLSIVAAGQRYRQTERFNYLGGTISADATMDAELASRIRVAWCALRKYGGQFYDRPVTVVPLDLKVKQLRSEALEALLYGCSTWTLRKKDYDKLRTHHHRMLLRPLSS